MKERPILFSEPMVRALLAGTKTQTRRLVKPQPHEDYFRLETGRYHPTVIDGDGDEQPGPERFGAWTQDGEQGWVCPYGQPGDRMWVREAWNYRYSASTPAENQFLHGVRYRADGTCREVGPMPMDGIGLPKQRERRPDESWQERGDYLSAYWRRWRPSIHMPRWASRITLEITGIRVERLQDISEADALAEGVDAGAVASFARTARVTRPAGHAYRDLWESINSPGSWDANPWVWWVSFRRIDAS